MNDLSHLRKSGAFSVMHFHIGNRKFDFSKKLAVLLASFVVLVFIGIIARPAIADQLRDWKVLPSHEPLTELYFFDHLRLATKYTPGQPQNVAFTIRNFEGSQQTYSYRITATPEGTGSQATTLKEGSLHINDKAARTVQESVTIPDLGKRIRIEIIINNNQSISYWVERV